jgi:outer membrane protein assembly factor BamA
MKRIYIFAVLLVIAPGLFAQENTITSISVSGLKRTKPHVVEGPLQIFIGRDAESLDKNEVIAVIQATGVVEPLTVEIEDALDEEGNVLSGCVLAVTVRDKWSIFPVPFFGISQSGWSVGGAFMDTNFLGRKDMLMVTGSGGTSGWMANVMYFHSPAMIGEFGWSATGMFLWQDKENVDQTNKQVLRRYNSMTINPSIGVSYKLTDLFTPTLGIAYKGVLLRDTDNPVNAPENDMHGITFSPGIGIMHNTWDGYFLNEQSASLTLLD